MKTQAEKAQQRIDKLRRVLVTAKKRPAVFLPRHIKSWEDEIASLLPIAKRVSALPKPKTSAAPGRQKKEIAAPGQGKENAARPSKPLPKPAEAFHATRNSVHHSAAQVPKDVLANKATEPNPRLPIPAAEQNACFTCGSADHHTADCLIPRSTANATRGGRGGGRGGRGGLSFGQRAPRRGQDAYGANVRASFFKDHSLDANKRGSWLLYKAFIKAEAAKTAAYIQLTFGANEKEAGDDGTGTLSEEIDRLIAEERARIGQ